MAADWFNVMNEPSNPAKDAATLTNQAIIELRKSLQDFGTSRLYILCDPMLEDELGAAANEKDYPCRKLDFTYSDLERSSNPYLIEIADEPQAERFVNFSIQVAVDEVLKNQAISPSPRSVCAWIIAPELNLNTFASLLGKSATLVDPYQIGVKRLFRFWDPRVMTHLPRIFSGLPFEHWLGANTAWLTMNIDGVLECTHFTNVHAESDWPFEPTKQQWDAIARIENLNQVLRLSEAWSSQDFLSTSIAIDNALIRAQRLGIVESLDSITYALLYRSLGGAFEKHHLMHPVFLEFSQGVSLTTLLADVDQVIWDRIRADLANTLNTQVK